VYPDFQQDLAEFSTYMRETAAEENEQIILLKFTGEVYSIDPGTEKEYQVEYKELSAFGPYEITRDLRFPDD
jgi:hypothetical protein